MGKQVFVQGSLAIPMVRPVAVMAVGGCVQIAVVHADGTHQKLLEMSPCEADLFAGHITSAVTEIMNKRRGQAGG